MSSFPQNATIVLVHGAWADGSCWQKIILRLREEGLKVTAAPIPLTSLTDDIAALQRVLERTGGPVALVGHAYAGAVMAGPDDERVKSLVYMAALAPADERWRDQRDLGSNTESARVCSPKPTNKGER
jgi:pimeloyl-ACP methyl ester carboxylesterase